MLDAFSSFVHRIHVHPTVPGTMATGPDKVRALPADFQTLPTAILQVYHGRHKPSHELEIIIIANAALIALQLLANYLILRQKTKEIPRCAANAYCSWSNRDVPPSSRTILEEPEEIFRFLHISCIDSILVLTILIVINRRINLSYYCWLNLELITFNSKN